MSCEAIRYHVVRDTDDPDRPRAMVESIQDLVLLEVRNGDHPPESILVHPQAARRIAAALIVEAMRADAVAAASACEGEEKGGLG